MGIDYTTPRRGGLGSLVHAHRRRRRTRDFLGASQGNRRSRLPALRCGWPGCSVRVGSRSATRCRGKRSNLGA